jgi:hypothetical protein
VRIPRGRSSVQRMSGFSERLPNAALHRHTPSLLHAGQFGFQPIVEGRYRPRPRLGRDEPASQAFQLNMGVGSQIRPKRTAEHLGQGVIQAYTPWLVHVRSRAVVS